MSKKIFCILVIFISLISVSFAEEISPRAEYGNTAVGFNFQATMSSFISGLTYQQWYENDFGYQITLGAVSSGNIDFYSADIQLQKLLCVNQHGRKNLSSLFVWANTGVSSVELEVEKNSYAIKPIINLGAGFGFEFVWGKRISIPIKMGCMGHILNNPGFGLTLGTGVLYRF